MAYDTSRSLVLFNDAHVANRFVYCAPVIGTSCPGLKNLAVSEICHFVQADGVSPGMFARLHAVELWALPGVHMPASVIRQLTCNCVGVRNLLFRNCPCLDDRLLTETWSVSVYFAGALVATALMIANSR